MPDAPSTTFDTTESWAHDSDHADPLAPYRDRFYIPAIHGRHAVYMTGNSLGLQPRTARNIVEQELNDWGALAVDGHLDGKHPWLPYHEWFRGPAARLVGARPGEVVMMNSLTVNLHLLMVSFYRPTPQRHKIVIEDDAFPSDSYAVASQIAFHGYDPATSLIRLKPRAGERTLRTEDVEDYFKREGEQVALAMLGGVNYLTGQWFHMERLTQAARAQGCVVGWDLAHAAGNVPLKLHDWGVDWAAFCTYKYLNSGPGAIAGAFVHERHASADLPRFHGWWGNDPATRFRMVKDFAPVAGAEAWQLSNPPILSLAPVRASMAIFEEVGMDALRAKSVRLTAYLEFLLNEKLGDRIEIWTPTDPDQRGCQLSISVRGASRQTQRALHEDAVITDFREPDVIRVAPVPLYNSYHDVWRLVDVLSRRLGG
ncbi:MAG: kynureninase [Phycisphaerales bacterium]